MDKSNAPERIDQHRRRLFGAGALTLAAAQLGMPTLYTLFDGDSYGEHLLELDCGTPGLSLFSATFG